MSQQVVVIMADRGTYFVRDLASGIPHNGTLWEGVFEDQCQMRSPPINPNSGTAMNLSLFYHSPGYN